MNRFGDISYSAKRLPPIYGYYAQKLVPLEKALEPVEAEIEGLPQFIKTAKRYCHFPSEHGLTHDESAAIYIYTMEWGDSTLYRRLNAALRSEDRGSLKVWFAYLKLFDTALDKLPTVKEVVWRGVPLDIGKNFTKNQLVTWWSVNSCSSSVNVIKTFLQNEKQSTLFLIEAINGKNIAGYTEFQNEDEVIMKMGSQFRVKSDPLKKTDNTFVVHLIEIDDKANECSTSRMIDASSSEISISKGLLPNISKYARWVQTGITVAGGNGKGRMLNQLNDPYGIYIDDEQTVFITDFHNHRIVKWTVGATTGQVVAGDNGQGTRLDQLDRPADVAVDRETQSIIICDRHNERVMRWSLKEGTTHGEIIIANIACRGLTIDDQGSIYISDTKKHEVRVYRRKETVGKIVAGGNGAGHRLNQLDTPTYVFVDQEYSVYVSDYKNHRVVKWLKGAKEGIVVAGGHGEGSSLARLSNPEGIYVDTCGMLYVADERNHRIMRWPSGAKQGEPIILNETTEGKTNQLRFPIGLSFDRYGHLYIADLGNQRIQRFPIEKD